MEGRRRGVGGGGQVQGKGKARTKNASLIVPQKTLIFTNFRQSDCKPPLPAGGGLIPLLCTLGKGGGPSQVTLPGSASCYGKSAGLESALFSPRSRNDLRRSFEGGFEPKPPPAEVVGSNARTTRKQEARTHAGPNF